MSRGGYVWKLYALCTAEASVLPQRLRHAVSEPHLHEKRIIYYPPQHLQKNLHPALALCYHCCCSKRQRRTGQRLLSER